MLDTELFRVQTATSGSFYLQEPQVLLTYADKKKHFLFLQQLKIKLSDYLSPTYKFKTFWRMIEYECLVEFMTKGKRKKKRMSL